MSVVRSGACQLGLRFGDLDRRATISQRFFGALLRRLRGGLVEIVSAQRSVREHGHDVRLDLDGAARHVEELLLAGRRLHADFAWPECRQERCVPRSDADIAHDRRHDDHRGFAREDLAFGANDIDVDGRGHGYCSVFAFATASSMSPTM